MSNVGFDGPYPERVTERSLLTQHVVDGSGLDRVPDSGPRPMSLDKAAFIWVQIGISVNLSHKVLWDLS